MSVAQIVDLLQTDGMPGERLRRELASSFFQSITPEAITPILLSGAEPLESTHLARHLHRVAGGLFAREGDLFSRQATDLHEQLIRNKRCPLSSFRDGTLHLTHLDALKPKELSDLLTRIQESHTYRQGNLLIVGQSRQTAANELHWFSLQSFFAHQLHIPPLHQRSTDIDPIIYQLFEEEKAQHDDLDDLVGFSLEAIAHIHRGILQTQRTYQDLTLLLRQLISRVRKQRLPLQEGYIVAWPTVRILEDEWGYRLLDHSALNEAFQAYDFQERLFSASLEHSAQQSGFSRDLVEQQCHLLQSLIEELPAHQRNYQGLTARLDQLTWIGMKLISNARTQAELRDFFGFGSKGKIPKATAKLKFDQHQLDQYGFRSIDPVPWPGSTTEEAQVPTPEPPAAQPASAPRHIHTIEGELAETFFWRHQDLFTILAADPLSSAQIAAMMQVAPQKVEAELAALLEHGLLEKEGDLYRLGADDLYYKHSHSQLRFLEENLVRYLGAAFHNENDAVLDNIFLRIPDQGLQHIRQELFDPFLHQQLLPLSDPCPQPDETGYEKDMYALLLIGTHRLSPQIHGKLPLQERISYYFQEACLQRVDRKQKHQAICLQATLMLNPSQASQAIDHVQTLRKDLRAYLPQGRGNKPNFNQTLCFTKVPLMFYRDIPQNNEPTT